MSEVECCEEGCAAFTVRTARKGPWPKRCPPHHEIRKREKGYRRNRRPEPPELRKRHARRAVLKRYGLSEEEFEELVAAQGGGCGICGRTEDRVGRRLSIDHNHIHDHGRQAACEQCRRGALCSSCNTALGLLGDDLDTVMSAYWYLARWTDIQSDLWMPDPQTNGAA